MPDQKIQLVRVLWLILWLILPGVAQNAPGHASQGLRSSPPEPIPTFRVSTRMVTVEVVARDHQGFPVKGLKPGDFQVFERIPGLGNEKHPQKIAAFREVDSGKIASHAASPAPIPSGIYANLIPLQKNSVPPAILLVDGLNTDLKYQAQVHVQMLRMLRQLPTDVPVAVFLLGRRLEMLQDFTTNPAQLQAALARAVSATGAGLATVDPRDDPDSPSAQMATMPHAPPGLVDAMMNFEQSVYAASMSQRVGRTIEALTLLAHHVEGYPGRKNLLWISTAFPIYLTPVQHEIGYENYSGQLENLANVLSQSRVAVYPINVGGVETSALFDAAARPRDGSGPAVLATLAREAQMRNAELDAMQDLAAGTGGKVCTGNNDLGDCVHKAVSDSSDFYEIAYYPDSQNWKGEYRRIIVKTKLHGLRLGYRPGYFAMADDGVDAKNQKAHLRGACGDYPDATSIFIAAKSLPSDSAEKLNFYFVINASALTLIPMSDGNRNLNIDTAVCTFDKKGNPLQLMSYPENRKVSENEYESLLANGLPQAISIPGPKTASLRLLVMDIPSGRLGSLYIRLDSSRATSAISAGQSERQLGAGPQ